MKRGKHVGWTLPNMALRTSKRSCKSSPPSRAGSVDIKAVRGTTEQEHRPGRWKQGATCREHRGGARNCTRSCAGGLKGPPCQSERYRSGRLRAVVPQSRGDVTASVVTRCHRRDLMTESNNHGRQRLTTHGPGVGCPRPLHRVRARSRVAGPGSRESPTRRPAQRARRTGRQRSRQCRCCQVARRSRP
jgi:hypothetical protein